MTCDTSMKPLQLGITKGENQIASLSALMSFYTSFFPVLTRTPFLHTVFQFCVYLPEAFFSAIVDLQMLIFKTQTAYRIRKFETINYNRISRIANQLQLLRVYLSANCFPSTNKNKKNNQVFCFN